MFCRFVRSNKLTSPSFQEKSKLSLAEVYEQEYLKQQGQAEEAGKAVSVLDKEGGDNPKEVEEIRQALTLSGTLGDPPT